MQVGTRNGKHTKNEGKSPLFMAKSTISMAIFNSYFDITRGHMVYAKENHGVH